MVRYGKAGCGTWLATDMEHRRYKYKCSAERQPEVKHTVLPDVYMTLPAGEFKESKSTAVDHGLKDVGIDIETVNQSVTTPEDKEEKENTDDAGQTESCFPVEKSWLDLLAKTVELYLKGIEGDMEAVDGWQELSKRIILMVPENNLLKAYLGSTIALLSMGTLNTKERFNKAVKNLEMLDLAISVEPDNIEMRTLRAYVSYCLPETIFQRTDTAVEDFNYLAARYEKEPTIFSREFYWQVLYDLGEAYRRMEQKGEMLTVWDNLLSMKSDLKFSKMIQDKLSNRESRW